MRIKSLILICLTLSNYLVLSQNEGIAIYKKKSNLNIPSDTINTSMHKILKNANTDVSNFAFELKFDKSLSEYKQLDNLKTKESLSIGISKILSGYSGKVNTNLDADKIIKTRIIGGENFFVESKVLDIKWTIEKDLIKIGKYKCYKATTVIVKEGRKGVMTIPVEAWFTPDINVQHGPEGFVGLPGLIIQLKIKDVLTYLDSIEFKKLKEKIETPKEKTISKIKFDSIMKDMNLNRRKYFNR